MMWQIRYENNQTFIYLFIYAASPINYMYMKTTIQNSHTHTHREKKKKLYGRDTTTAFANYCGSVLFGRKDSRRDFTLERQW